MNFDVVYGMVAIALAIVAYVVAPQLWYISGNDAVCGDTVADTVPADMTEADWERCKDTYDFFQQNELLLYITAVVFFLVGIVLLIKGFVQD